jgi:predicted ATP-grasp superfamily ATP-dependent carboligase
LQSIAFDGMAEAEFKWDPRDGKYKLLDVNLRPWGWHGIGSRAGVDFAYLVWRLKTGREINPVTGAGQAAWFRELNGFAAIGASPNRLSALGCLLKAMVHGRLVGAAFALSDPIPLAAEFALKAKKFFDQEPLPARPVHSRAGLL